MAHINLTRKLFRSTTESLKYHYHSMQVHKLNIINTQSVYHNMLVLH